MELKASIVSKSVALGWISKQARRKATVFAIAVAGSALPLPFGP